MLYNYFDFHSKNYNTILATELNSQLSQTVQLPFCKCGKAVVPAFESSFRGSLNWSSKLGIDSPYKAPIDGRRDASTLGFSAMAAGFNHPVRESVVLSRCGVSFLSHPSSGSCMSGTRLRKSTGRSGTLVRIGTDTGE